MTRNLRLGRRGSALLVFAVFIGASAGCRGEPAAPVPVATPPPPGPAITKSPDEVTGGTRYALVSGTCTLEADVKIESDELQVARHSRCGGSGETYLERWSQLLREIIRDQRFDGSAIHLQWGRIAAPVEDPLAPTLSARLAMSVRALPGWDGARGVPSKAGRSVNDVVMREVQPATLFPELARLAGELGYSVRIEWVEKVLVGPPSSWPAGASRVAAGSELLPYDAQVVFLLERRTP